MKTQGFKYIGSKKFLLDSILEQTSTVYPKVVWDGFSGTTRVSQAFAQSGYKVISSDVSEWSRVLATCYLKCTKEKKDYESLIDHLNNLKPIDGWFTENYGQNDLKCPYQRHNLQRLDSIREEIDKLELDEVDKSVALTSLLLALDKVDNTLGHYSSYLKNWSKRSYNNLELVVPNLFNHREDNLVIKEDVFDIVDGIECDLAYFDPPYGSSNLKMPPSRVRYSAYYHLLTTICLNDKPKLFGKARRRDDSRDAFSYSPFEDFRKDENGDFISIKAIVELVSRTNAKNIFLSYYNQSPEILKNLLDKLGNIATIKAIKSFNHKKNVMAFMKTTCNWTPDEDIKNQELIISLEHNDC